MMNHKFDVIRKIIDKNGEQKSPRMLPCGTPRERGVKTPSIQTACDLSERIFKTSLTAEAKLEFKFLKTICHVRHVFLSEPNALVDFFSIR